VNVIGHQHVGVDAAVEAAGETGQFVQITSVVFLRAEAHAAVVASLDDVPGDAGDSQTGSAGHRRSVSLGIASRLPEIIVVCPQWHYLKEIVFPINEIGGG